MIASSRLAVQLHTLFILTETGRIERENDPDRSPGPRLWLAGCASGNVVAVRHDVPEGIAGEIIALATAEPPFTDWNNPPKYLDRYVGLLATGAPLLGQSLGVIYRLPHHLQYDRDLAVIDDESEAGRRAYELLSSNGMPAGLVEMGFRSATDLWRPWCMARVNGDVASVAFAARISERGAELGVATARAFRGRGYAAAVVAGWSRLPALQSRKLFYSTDGSNASSRRVATRLGLDPLGATLRLW